MVDESRTTDSIRGASSAICFLLTLLFLVRSVRYKHHRVFSRWITLVLIGCNFAGSTLDLTELLIGKPGETACTVIGFLRGFLIFSAVTWSLVLSVNVFSLIHYNRDIKRYRVLSFTLAWLVPLVLAIIPLVGEDNYGEASFWCWIKGGSEYRDWLRMICFYIPLWVVIVAVIVLFVRTMRTVYTVKARVRGFMRDGARLSKCACARCLHPARRHTLRPCVFAPDAALAALRRRIAAESLLVFTLKKLIYLPLVFVLVWAFPTFHRILGCVPGLLARAPGSRCADQGRGRRGPAATSPCRAQLLRKPHAAVDAHRPRVHGAHARDAEHAVLLPSEDSPLPAVAVPAPAPASGKPVQCG